MAIDSEGKTQIRSPAAYTAWAKKLRKAMPPFTDEEDLLQPFKVEQGASQGAELSPYNWLAFSDILLVALSSHEVKKDNILLPGLPGKLIYTQPNKHGWP